jgi:glycosyltransferase involved in cell wall biosynthesis
MADKIKVLLLDTNDAFGGVVRGHTMFLRITDRARFEMYAAVLGHGAVLPRFLEIPNVTFWKIEVGTKPAQWCVGWRGRLVEAWSVVPLAWTALRLAVLCRRAGIQLIHSSDKKRSLLLVLLLHKLTGIPYLYHIHNNYIDYPANRQALERASLIFANSGEMRRDFIHWLGPTMERIRVVYNGMDAERFRPGLPSTLRQELGAAPDDVLIGISSRLAPDKGQETFLQAAALVIAQEPRARFVVVGDDAIFSDNADYVPMLRKMAAEKGLAGRVHFLGFRSDMSNIYPGLDILVNAAWREAFGLVVVEAMACAKPVVGTQAGGIPEIITHGQDGFLFPVRDAHRLAELLLDLVRQPELRQRLGVAARQTVLDRFTIQRQVRDHEALYEELVGRPMKT